MTNLRGHALSASGKQLSPEEVSAMNEATAWYATLHSGITTEKQQHAWKDWYEANTVHQSAWDTVIRVCAQFDRVAVRTTQAIQTPAARYRNTLHKMLVAVVLGVTAVISYQSLPFKEWRSDYATRSGEQRDVVLEDGSSLSLQAQTSVDVTLTDTQRLVRLHAGEIQITTHTDQYQPARLFVVNTLHGQIATVAASFTVRIEQDQTIVTVQDQSVDVTTNAGHDAVHISAGQRIRLLSDGIVHNGSDVW